MATELEKEELAGILDVPLRGENRRIRGMS